MSRVENLPDGSVMLRFGDAVPLGREVRAAMNGTDFRKSVDENLADLRTSFRQLRDSDIPKDREIAESINWRFSYDNADAGDMWPSDMVTDAVGWLATAGDTDLVDFCTQNGKLYHQQQAALDSVTPELQLDTINRVDKLIDLGLLPKSSRKVYQNAIDSPGHRRLWAADSFDAGGEEADGYYSYGYLGKVVISNKFQNRAQYTGVTGSFRDTTFHEHFHMTGYPWRRRGHWPMPRVLEEVEASHLTLVSGSSQPQPDIIAHSQRIDEGLGASYHGECDLIGTLVEASEVSSDDLVQGFFDPKRRGSRARLHVESKLDENIRDILPEFQDDGFDGFVFAYEHTPTSRIRRERVAAWVSEAQKNTESSRASAATLKQQNRINAFIACTIQARS